MLLVSSTVERLIASRYTGNAQTTSRRRERMPSSQPPKKPASMPMIVAKKQVRSAADVPISSELRPP